MKKSDSLVSAYVTNLTGYAAGRLVGEWVSFPTTSEEMHAVVSRIARPGDELFVTDYDSSREWVAKALLRCGEFPDLSELNFLAAKLDDLTSWELDIFEAAVEMGDYGYSLADLIDLTDSLDSFDLLEGVEDEEDLGRYYVEELDALEVPDYLLSYFDFAAYGRDIYMEDNGGFVTGGYLHRLDDGTHDYTGVEDIPGEYLLDV